METTTHSISKMTRQDLVNIAKELPTTGQDHYWNLIWHYEKNNWNGVNDYIESVYLYDSRVTNPNREPKESLWEIICRKWYNLSTKIDQWLTSLLNRLD